MEPTIRRIKTTQYFKNPETKQIYSLYEVRVTMPNQRPKYFPSEEHAAAFVEKRPVDHASLLSEYPDESLREYVKKINAQQNKQQTDNENESIKEVNFVLASYGARKVQIVKLIREVTGMNLRECKEMVDSVPSVVKEQISMEDAEELKRRFEDAGASVEIK